MGFLNIVDEFFWKLSFSPSRVLTMLLIILLLPISGILKLSLGVNALLILVLDQDDQINIGTLSSIIQKNIRNVAIRTSQAMLLVGAIELVLKGLGDIAPESYVLKTEDIIVSVGQLAASLVDPLVLLVMLFILAVVNIFVPNNNFLERYILWRDSLNSPLIFLLTITSLTFFGGQAAANMVSRWEVSLRQENQSQQRDAQMLNEEIAAQAITEATIIEMDDEAKQDFVALLEYNYPTKMENLRWRVSRPFESIKFDVENGRTIVVTEERTSPISKDRKTELLSSAAKRSANTISRNVLPAKTTTASGYDFPVVVNINKQQAKIERLEEQRRQLTSDMIKHSNVSALLAESIELLLQQLLPPQLQGIGKTYANSFTKSLAESLSQRMSADRFPYIKGAREWVRTFLPEAQRGEFVERAPNTPSVTESKTAIRQLVEYFQEQKERAERLVERMKSEKARERTRNNTRARPAPR